MKLLKIATALLLVVSLNADEIKPFGKFNFGDSITPTIKNICQMNSIQKITLETKGEKRTLTKNTFCNEGIREITSLLSDVNLNQINDKVFRNIGNTGKSLIIADGVNIKGVEFKIILNMFKDDTKNLIGKYIATKNDAIKVTKRMNQWINGEIEKVNVTLEIPLVLREVILEAKSLDMLKSNRQTIYNLLKNKYSNMIKYKNKREKKKSEKYFTLDIKGDNKTKLYFGVHLEYTTDDKLKYRNIYQSYLRNKPSSKPDSSGDL